MPNAMFTKTKEKVWRGQINLMDTTIKVAQVKNTYVPNLAGHEFLTDFAAHLVGDPVVLTGRSITGGAFDAADPKFESVPSGQTVAGLVTFIDTGVPGTSILLHYVDEVAGLPAALTGGDVTYQWSNGVNKIFAL